MIMGNFGIFIVVVLLGFQMCDGQTFNDTDSLRTFLLSGYSASLRPGSDQTAPLNISISLSMALLKEFNEVTSSFTFIGYLTVRWNDHRLQWSTASYGGLSNMVFTQNELWLPPLLVYNPTESFDLIGFSDDRVRVSNDGSVLWQPPEVFEFICEADVTYFPFDQQTCTLVLRTCGYQTTDLNFNQEMNMVQMTSSFTENGIWKIDKSYTLLTEDMNAQFLSFGVVVTRRSVFYLINLSFPMMAMSVLQLFVYLLPADSGERVGYSITVALAISVFLSIVTAFLPTTAIPTIPLMCYKLFIDFLICSLILFSTILNMRFHLASQDEAVPKFAQSFAKKINSPCFCSRNKPEKTSVIQIKIKSGETQSDKELTEDEPEPNITWQDVGRAADRFSLFLFAIMLMAENLVFFGFMFLH